MNKLWKSLIVFLACAALILSSSSPVLAQSASTTYTYDGKVYTITSSTDSNNVITVNVTSADEASTVVLNKNINTFTITDVDAQGTMVINGTMPTVDLTIVSPTIVDTTAVNLTTASPAAADATAVDTTAVTLASKIIASGNEPMFKHYYSVSKMGPPTYYTWVVCKSLNAGICKTRKETAGNVGDLTGFKDDVNSASKNEVIAGTMVGASVLSVIAGILAGAPTVTISIIIGLLVAAGAAIGAAAYILGLGGY